MRPYARILAFTAYTAVFCIVGGEITVRALYGHFRNYNMEMWRYACDLKMPLRRPGLPFHHFPNKKGTYYGVEIATNSLGFRDMEYTANKRDGRRRILVLGDSFTLGWGVDVESTFTERLESLLAQQGEACEVINMGIGNYNTTMEVELFKWKGLQLDPDMVILMFFLNDTEPIPPRKSPLKYAVIKHSYFGSFLFDRLVRLRARLVETFEWDTYYRNLYSPINAANLQANTESIKELISICRERQIRLLIASIPELRNPGEYQFEYATAYIRDLAEQDDMPFLDLLPSFESYEPESLWVSPEDQHANSRAHAIIAEEIRDMIAGEKSL